MIHQNLFRYLDIDNVLVKHYQTHLDEYTEIHTRLDELREAFLNADPETQVRLLHLSYIFAVTSIRTPVEFHEPAFEAVAAEIPLREAFKSVNYNNQKATQIKETLPKIEMWHRVRNALAHGNSDEAHEILLKEAKGVGTAKAPFVLSMLGFTEKMCIDANVINLLGLPGTPDMDSVEEYDALCADICDLVPSLELPPFLIQWLMFDYQRTGRVTPHDVWWDVTDEVIAESEIETAIAA